jgi:hypothetical protein
MLDDMLFELTITEVAPSDPSVAPSLGTGLRRTELGDFGEVVCERLRSRSVLPGSGDCGIVGDVGSVCIGDMLASDGWTGDIVVVSDSVVGDPIFPLTLAPTPPLPVPPLTRLP